MYFKSCYIFNRLETVIGDAVDANEWPEHMNEKEYHFYAIYDDLQQLVCLKKLIIGEMKWTGRLSKESCFDDVYFIPLMLWFYVQVLERFT